MINNPELRATLLSQRNVALAQEKAAIDAQVLSSYQKNLLPKITVRKTEKDARIKEAEEYCSKVKLEADNSLMLTKKQIIAECEADINNLETNDKISIAAVIGAEYQTVIKSYDDLLGGRNG